MTRTRWRPVGSFRSGLTRISRVLIAASPILSAVTAATVLVALSWGGWWPTATVEHVVLSVVLGVLVLLLPDLPVLAGGRLFPYPLASTVMVLSILLFGPVAAMTAGVLVAVLYTVRRWMLTDEVGMPFRQQRVLLDASLTWLTFLTAILGYVLWPTPWGALTGYAVSMTVGTFATFAVERDIGYRYPRNWVSVVEMMLLPVAVTGAGLGVGWELQQQGTEAGALLAVYAIVTVLLASYVTWSRDRWTRDVNEAAHRFTNWMKHRHVGLLDDDPVTVGYVEAATMLEFVSLLQQLPGITGVAVSISPDFDASSPLSGQVYEHSGRGGMMAVIPQPLSPSTSQHLADMEASPQTMSIPLYISDVNVGVALIVLSLRFRTAFRSPALHAMVNTFALGLTSLRQARDLLTGVRWSQIEHRYDARTGLLTDTALRTAGDDLLRRTREKDLWVGVAHSMLPPLADITITGLSADRVLLATAERAREAVPHLLAVAGSERDGVTIMWAGFSREHVEAALDSVTSPLVVTDPATASTITVGLVTNVVVAEPDDTASFEDILARVGTPIPHRREGVSGSETAVVSEIAVSNRDGLESALADALTGLGQGLSVDSGPVHLLPNHALAGRWYSLRWTSPLGDVHLHGDALFTLAQRIGLWAVACDWLATLVLASMAEHGQDGYVIIPATAGADVPSGAQAVARLPRRAQFTVSPVEMDTAEALIGAFAAAERGVGVLGVGALEDTIALTAVQPITHAVLDMHVTRTGGPATARLIGSQIRYAELRGYDLLEFSVT